MNENENKHYELAKKVSAEFWDEQCWKKDKLFFHWEKPFPSLVKCYDKVFKEKDRVFVPLCGKTLDLMWLINKGHEVVGLEYSEIAVKAVFETNHLEHTVTKSGKFDIYQANSVPLTIYKGDYYDLCDVTMEPFDVAWDKGGFCALHYDYHSEYVKILLNLLKPAAKWMLITCTFDMTKLNGPPYHFSDDYMSKNFGEYFAEELTILDKFVKSGALSVDITLITNLLIKK